LLSLWIALGLAIFLSPATGQLQSDRSCLSYEPQVVELSGFLDSERFFGPPGYGESPKEDPVEEAWILILDRPICVLASSNFRDANTPPENGVSRIQLVPQGEISSALKGWKEQNIMVRGTLFHSHTGHHHAPVLMNVQRALPAARAASPSGGKDCMDSAVTQLEMNDCAGAKAANAKKKLDQLLAELISKQPAASQKSLVDIEKDWQKLVVKDCGWEAAFFEGGSVMPMVYTACVEQRTLERIRRLAQFLCEGGGMTGPCPESGKYLAR
jgi:uncharacterized protein YecT (DUF1311 family)